MSKSGLPLNEVTASAALMIKDAEIETLRAKLAVEKARGDAYYDNICHLNRRIHILRAEIEAIRDKDEV